MRTLRTPVLFFAIVACASCAGVQLPSPTGGATAGGSDVAADVIRYTNDARYRNGLPALATSARLMDAARIHAAQMAKFQRADHTISGAEYPTLQSRLQAVGYIYMNAAENVAWNQQSPQAALNSWMSSAGHRANILDPNLKEIGAAMARGAKGEPYWIQVFGTPR
jgi:uncharacterized protein YkwD